MTKPTLFYGSFLQYDKVFLTEDDGIDITNIQSMAYEGDSLYILQPEGMVAYKSGVIHKYHGNFTKVFSRGGRLYAAMDHKLVQIHEGAMHIIEELDDEVLDISIGIDKSMWLLTGRSLYLKQKDSFERIVGVPEGATCIAAVDNASKYGETVYIGTKDGLLSMKGKRRHWAELTPDMTGVLSQNIRCLSVDALGHLWVGTDAGMNIYDGRSYWINGRDYYAVPDGAFNEIVMTPDGKKYFATDTGLVTLIEGKISYFSYGAWLLHPKVTALAVSESGIIAAATPRGISLIYTLDMTLEDKAAWYDEQAVKYYTRNEGYQVTRALRKYGDMEDGWLPNSDNDGLFTGVYCASQCFRYAVTEEEEARDNAKRAVEALIKLTQVTGKPGFTARATRYAHEEDFGTGERSEWHICVDNPDCEWLGETSSDEMTGHFYAYGIYYDLVADDAEKEKIREVVRAIMDHILENNFHLVDVDGIPTTWANWEPELLNHDDRWYFERGTNSLGILSFLKTAYHVTGDAKYQDVYEMLIHKHHYAMNCMQYKCEDHYVAHIDDQLDFINIYPLIQYEENPAYQAIYKMGLTHHWQYERVERSPFFNIVYGALTDNRCDIENAAQSLAEMNLDLIRWPMYNSYRKDIEWDTAHEKMGLPPQLKVPVEYSSRVLVHYDGNPFVCDSGAEEFIAINSKIVNRTSALPATAGADGKRAMMPYIYLLPYWMGRYYELLGD